MNTFSIIVAFGQLATATFGQDVPIQKAEIVFATTRPKSRIGYVSISPDGKKVAVLDESPGFTIYELSTKAKHVFNTDNNYNSVQFYNGAEKVICSTGNQLEVWNTSKAKVERFYKGYANVVIPFGKEQFLTISENDDRIVCLSEKTEVERIVFPRNKRTIAMSISQSRALLASVNFDANRLTIQNLKQLSGPVLDFPVVNSPRFVEITTDDHYAVVSNGDIENCAVYDCTNGKCVFEWNATRVALIDRDRFLSLHSHEKEARIYTVQGKLISRILFPEEIALVSSLSVSNDKKLFAVGFDVGTVKVFRLFNTTKNDSK